jgi:hypothetical protein
MRPHVGRSLRDRRVASLGALGLLHPKHRHFPIDSDAMAASEIRPYEGLRLFPTFVDCGPIIRHRGWYIRRLSAMKTSHVDRFQMRVPRNLGKDTRYVNRTTKRKQQSIDLGPSDHKYSSVPSQAECLFVALNNMAIGNPKLNLSAHNDRLATRQRLADRIVGLASHKQTVPHGDHSKPLQVRLETPRKFLIATDRSVIRNRDNRFQLGVAHENA